MDELSTNNNEYMAKNQELAEQLLAVKAINTSKLS